MFGKTDQDPGAPTERTDTSPSAGRNSGEVSIISADLKVVGNLQSDGEIQVDGTVEGDIKSRSLTVGERAQIEGSISADTVRICGTISGKVDATTVKIAKTANVSSDINYQTLSIEDGAVLEGTIRRVDSSKPASDSKVSTLKPAPTPAPAKVTPPPVGTASSHSEASGKPMTG